MMLFDKATPGKTRRTADGYVVADVRVARTGIQEYAGAEIGRPDLQMVRVYRPESEVFARDSLSSYAHKPVTNDHPAKMVTADSWKAAAVGQIGEDVVRDGEFVRVPLVLMDSTAIKDFESGKRELSMGYTAEIVFDSGETPEGEQYDAVQTNLRMNHVALVARARGGDQLRIGDGTHKRKPTMSDTKTVMVDGLSVVTTDAGAQAIEKLQRQIAEAATNHEKALAVKDAALAKVEAERDAALAKVMTDAQIDARVQARADLISKAKTLHDADYAGKTDAEIRRAVVLARVGDAAIADKSEAYIDARFDVLCEDVKTADPIRQTIKAGPAPVADSGSAYQAYVAGLDYRTRNAAKA